MTAFTEALACSGMAMAAGTKALAHERERRMLRDRKEIILALLKHAYGFECELPLKDVLFFAADHLEGNVAPLEEAVG